MTGIYKITSPSGKVYIGQSVDINIRKKSYKSSPKKSQRKIYNSIKKYGFDNHCFSIIEKCGIDRLNERERYFQEFYDSVNNGLNCRYQGTNDKSGKLSKETIHKMRNRDITYMLNNDFRTGIPHTDEIKRKISNSLKGLMSGEKNPMFGMMGDKNPFYGKKHTEESRLKISNKNKSNKENCDRLKEYNEKRKIVLIDIQTGVFYESISEASKLLNINYVTLKAMLSGQNRNKTNLIKI